MVAVLREPAAGVHSEKQIAYKPNFFKYMFTSLILLFEPSQPFFFGIQDIRFTINDSNFGIRMLKQNRWNLFNTILPTTNDALICGFQFVLVIDPIGRIKKLLRL